MGAYKLSDRETKCPGVVINEWAFDFGTRFTINDQGSWERWPDVQAEAARRCAALVPKDPTPDHKCGAPHGSLATWSYDRKEWDIMRCPTGECDQATGWCKDPVMYPPPVIPDPTPDHKCGAPHGSLATWSYDRKEWDIMRCPTGECDQATGWCKDPVLSPPPEDVPAIPDLPECPKGSSYPGNAFIAVTRMCSPGYDAVGGLTNTKCVCASLTEEEYFKESPEAVQEFYTTPEEQQKGAHLPDPSAPEWFGGFGDLMKMLPQLIMVLVVVQIIGAFRK